MAAAVTRVPGATTGAFFGLTIFAAIVACGEERPPPPGTNLDAERPDAHAGDGGGWTVDASRPATPRLPPADIEVTLPYLGPTQQIEMRTAADLARLDVHFSIDTTGSFGGEIDVMQAELDERIVPALSRRVADIAFGVSRFEDFPLPPYGAPADRPFRLLSAITTERARTRSAVASLDDPLGQGGDMPEASFEALYQIATGEGYAHGGTTYIAPFPGRAPGGGTVGGAGFREGALRAVVHVTDAPSHVPREYVRDFPGTHSLADAVRALQREEVKVLGIASSPEARADLEAVAAATGAVTPPIDGRCRTGLDGALRPPRTGTCPLVFDIARDGSGLSVAVIDALVELVDAIRFAEVYGVAVDDALGFVQVIAAERALPPPTGTPPGVRDLRPEDGVDDTFTDVRPGTELIFAVRLRNETILPADYDQIFDLVVELRGDGLALSRQTVRVTVPRGRAPRPSDAGSSDAGSSDASSSDAGSPDAGSSDAGSSDAGSIDAGTLDSGAMDAGP